MEGVALSFKGAPVQIPLLTITFNLQFSFFLNPFYDHLAYEDRGGGAGGNGDEAFADIGKSNRDSGGDDAGDEVFVDIEDRGDGHHGKDGVGNVKEQRANESALDRLADKEHRHHAHNVGHEDCEAEVYEKFSEGKIKFGHHPSPPVCYSVRALCLALCLALHLTLCLALRLTLRLARYCSSLPDRHRPPNPL